jgi:hypothetical protein
MILYINTLEDIKTFYKNETDGFIVYGAGEVAIQFTTLVQYFYGTIDIIKKYVVSNKQMNNIFFNGKEVVKFNSSIISENDNIVLALGKKARKEVLETILDLPCNIYVIDSKIMFDDKCKSIFYEDCINDIKEYVQSVNYALNEKKISINDNKLYAWTCWWQGEECAPDIVKACINSQKLNLPSEVCHIIITKYNFRQFIEFPDYILEKVNDGQISYTTFSDIIREKLIYKYGGIWFDSTVLINKPFPIDFFKMPLFTCKSKTYDYGSFSQWSLWCMGAQKGNDIFKFLYQAFEYYYKNHNSIKYYLTVDYYIKAAMWYVRGANEQYNKIPFNNINADELAPHLKDKYTESDYEKYIDRTYISKLTYKHFSGRNGDDFTGFTNDSIYQFIINKYLKLYT